MGTAASYRNRSSLAISFSSLFSPHKHLLTPTDLSLPFPPIGRHHHLSSSSSSDFTSQSFPADACRLPFYFLSLLYPCCDRPSLDSSNPWFLGLLRSHLSSFISKYVAVFIAFFYLLSFPVARPSFRWIGWIFYKRSIPNQKILECNGLGPFLTEDI